MRSIPLRTIVLAVCGAAANGPAGAQTNPYTVTNGHINSAMQPQIRLDIDTSLHYVGSQRWILYSVAQAEQHLFVQQSAAGVERFLWVQFEEYIPSSNGRYDYSKDAPVAAFGRELRTSRQLWSLPTTETHPESDGAYSRKLLRGHGIVLPPTMLYERFIYLPDTSRRRELMVIYSERVKGDASSLPKDKLDSLLADHERRALRSFTISTQPRP
jgi:hypothetical protein